MVVGCYVIGEDVIHLSIPIVPSQSYAPEGCVSYFIAACKKLSTKLECIVIVDPECTEPRILKELFNIGQDYANSVHIIPAIVALLQHTVSTIKHFFINEILILMKVLDNFYVCDLLKENNLIYPLSVKSETINSLHLYSGHPYKDVLCLFQGNLKQKLARNLRLQFPTLNLLQLQPPMTTLALGGFHKARCIAEPGKHLEVANFTPGIYNKDILIVNRCAAFPLQIPCMQLIGHPILFRDILTVTSGIKKKAWKIKVVEVIVPAQSCFKNYIFEYNKYGLLSIKDLSAQLSFNIFNDFIYNSNKVHVWSMEKQIHAIFDTEQQNRNFVPFGNYDKNLFSNEWLNVVEQTTEFPSPPSDLHTVFVDNKKIYNYINGPKISIAPSYIGILQYYITYFKPTTPHLIILIILKNGSKLYALNQRSSLCYTVTYISDYSETLPLFDSNSVEKKTKILYIHEKGMNQTLSLNFLSTNISVTRFEISNLEEVVFYGGAIYALHNSSPTLTSPYVTINPLFDPEENAVDGLSTVSHRTCCYEIEAFFHGALKSFNSNLFYGDLIALILQIEETVYIYFFVHVKRKFLFKFDITVSASTIIDSSLLHFADYIVADVIVSEYSQMLKVEKDLSINFFKWDKQSGINAFLKDMNEEQLLIYDTPNYSEAIVRVVNTGVLDSIIFENTCVTIEYESDKCRILVENDHCVTVNGEEWIPMYISFSQILPIFGKAALADLENSPESVIHDFVKLIGVTSKTLLFDPKWKFQIVEMDVSDDPKIGFKVKTIQGYKIISPEIATTIYLRNLINIYEKHIGKSVDEIRFQLLETVFTEIQKEAFGNAAKRLNKNLVFC